MLRDDLHVDWGDAVEFRLTYQGLVLAETNKGELKNARATAKQEIRKKFHHQLKRLWEITPYLSEGQKEPNAGWNKAHTIFGRLPKQNTIQALALSNARFGYQFVPLITRDLDVVCSIDVLFLRNGPPGSVISAGDIDNRLKTLFDALTMPRTADQLGGYKTPESDETPFFCLLEDDSLITRASVETDTLLEPIRDIPIENTARVIVTVRTKLLHAHHFNLGFG